MKKIWLSVLLLACAFCSFAQKKTDDDVKYFGKSVVKSATANCLPLSVTFSAYRHDDKNVRHLYPLTVDSSIIECKGNAIFFSIVAHDPESNIKYRHKIPVGKKFSVSDLNGVNFTFFGNGPFASAAMAYKEN